jgi:tocopherol O-methyltransferase
MATATQIQKHYDSLAFIYRAFWGDHIHHGLFETGHETPQKAQVALIEHCAHAVGLQGREHVLDVGCGHGGTLLQLARTHGCSGNGITLSPKQACIANESATNAGMEERISVKVADADTFLFPPAGFDVVWAMESSEHFYDKHKFLRNAFAAVRPGGKLLVAAWTGSMEKARIREVARAFLCPELWTAQQYSESAARAGFDIVRSEELTEKVSRTWEICADRAAVASRAVSLLPKAAREFVEGIPIILDAYRSGDLTYSVLTAEKRSGK